ncbi:MAG TPA: MBL fold metallo-hydrolase [Hyphomonadaceae bacterium]|nr:MBL fold metallo-hydrolase [Hyphomonadaceae bacterium]
MIPFNRKFEFDYGVAHDVSPLVRRVVARNPGRFTWTGTGTLIVGREDVAVIDPGPDRDDHFAALEATIDGRPVSAVLVTHNHMDHSAIARRVADRFDAPLCGRRGETSAEDGGAARLEAGDDPHFSPDIELEDGWRLRGDGWTIDALHTPGHTAEHFCFSLLEEKTLFCGDHVMAWSTSIVTPPDGHMATYIDSLRRIRHMGFARLAPTHGPSIDSPGSFIDAYVEHRLQRRAQVLGLVGAGSVRIRQIVDALYSDLSPALRPAAALSVLAHLIQLVEEGLVVASPSCTLGADYRLSRPRATPIKRTETVEPALAN